MSSIDPPLVQVVNPVSDEPHEYVVGEGPLVSLLNQLGQLKWESFSLIFQT